jgi:hypothetical protein
MNASTNSLPMNGAWPTIRSYIFWQHERGTLHYDIMVTLILIFIFFSPRVINFNDKPTALEPHRTMVSVASDASGELVYRIDASVVAGGDQVALREQLRRVIAPISGDVEIAKYETITNVAGRAQEYRVWAKRKP